MSIVKDLLSREQWEAFLNYKRENCRLSSREEKELQAFVATESYLAPARRLNEGGVFHLPTAVKINKGSSQKKRTVFIFEPEEKTVQKFIAWKLLEFESVHADNLYSFRKNKGVKEAVHKVFFTKGMNECYCFKTDISDYFNSVNVSKLLPALREVLRTEPELYRLLEAMLTEPRCLVGGTECRLKKGILAGSPVAGFLANLYLRELDVYFLQKGVLYARYSDDIIFFSPTEGELQEHVEAVRRILAQKDLHFNPEKTSVSAPHESRTFLGFCYRDGVLDIAEMSKKKLKAKMRRKARALVRWKKRKNAGAQRAVRAFIKHFNKKLYGQVNDEITWSAWYFPLITTADSLKEMDAYMQQCMRFIATEKQNKGQYRFTYEQMKKLGYRTLVNSYYRFKSKGEILPLCKDGGEG